MGWLHLFPGEIVHIDLEEGDFSFSVYGHIQNNKLKKGIFDRIIGDCITSEQHSFPDNGKPGKPGKPVNEHVSISSSSTSLLTQWPALLRVCLLNQTQWCLSQDHAAS
jgi:hypothetical protein